MSYTDSDARIMYRNHHDWILPKRVFISIFVTAVVLEILGAILLGIGPSHGDDSGSFSAAGAVFLGLGFCLHVILMMLCCHAYCVVYMKDKDTQTADADLSDVDSKPIGIVVDASNLHGSDKISKNSESFYLSNKNVEPSDFNAGNNVDAHEPMLQHQSFARQGLSEPPLYAVVNKPPSAIKSKKSSLDRHYSDRKRVRMSPEVIEQSKVSRSQGGSPVCSRVVKDSDATPPFPINLSSEDTQMRQAAKSFTDEGDTFDLTVEAPSIRQFSEARYYPENKYKTYVTSGTLDPRYSGVEYSTIVYGRENSPGLDNQIITPKSNTLPTISHAHYPTQYSVHASPAIKVSPVQQTPNDYVSRNQPIQYTSRDYIATNTVSGNYNIAERPSSLNVASVVETSPDYTNLTSANGVLLRPSQRRPMTFEQFSASKMSVYDNMEIKNNSLV